MKSGKASAGAVSEKESLSFLGLKMKCSSASASGWTKVSKLIEIFPAAKNYRRLAVDQSEPQLVSLQSPIDESLDLPKAIQSTVIAGIVQGHVFAVGQMRLPQLH